MENYPAVNLGSVKAIGQSIDAEIDKLMNELDESVEAPTLKKVISNIQKKSF